MAKWGDYIEVPNDRETLEYALDKIKEQILESYQCKHPENYPSSTVLEIKEQLGNVESFLLGWCICPTTEYPLPIPEVKK